MPFPPDGELASAAQAGDRAAFGALAERHAQAAEAEREIGEELAAALASPRDARVLAGELRDRTSARARGA